MGKVTTRDRTEIFDKDRGEGRPVVASMFGPNGQRVLALIIRIPSLTADQVAQVTSAWKRGDPIGRAHAWAQLNRAATEEERYPILTAAALARREALEAARRLDRADWAFGPPPATPARPWRPAPGSAQPTTPWSPRSRRSCPRSASPRHPAAPRRLPKPARPSRPLKGDHSGNLRAVPGASPGRST
jgi:hypothetical protein